MSKPWIKRPLCFVCAVFMAASAVGYYIPSETRLLLICIFSASAAASAAACVFLKRFKHIMLLCAMIFVPLALASGVSQLYFGAYAGRLYSYNGTQHTVEGYVTRTLYSKSYGGSYEAVISRVDGKPSSFAVVLSSEFGEEMSENDVFTGDVVFSAPDESSFGFPMRRYYMSKGIILCAETSGAPLGVNRGAHKSVLSLFTSVNRRLSELSKRIFGKEEGAFVSAMLLGNRSDISDSLRRDFKRLGISHILAVSGLHVAIITSALEKLLRLLRTPFRLRYALMAIFAVLIVFLTGFQISAVRSVVMIVVFFGSRIAARDSDPPTALTFTVALMMLLSPASALDVGLMLSFMCTLALTTVFPQISLLLKRHINSQKGVFLHVLSGVLNSLALSLLIMLFTLPVMWLYFGEISLVSPISNLIFVPLSTLLLLGAPIAFSVSFIPFVGRFAAAVCALDAKIIIELASEMASRRFVMVSLGYTFTKYAVAAAAVAAVLLLFAKRKRISYIFIPFAAAALVFVPCLAVYNSCENLNTRFVFMTQKKNEGFAIKSDGKTLVCDISDGSYQITRAGCSIVENDFYSDDIDVYMLTHYHKRHVSTFVRLTENVYVRSVMLPEPTNENELHIASEISDIAGETGGEVIFYKAGADYSVFGSCVIEVSELAYINRSTHPVFAASVSTAGVSLLYVSASYAETEASSFLTIDRLNASDSVIFGIHGPKIKQPLPKELRTYVPSLAIAASNEVCEVYEKGADVVLDGYGDDWYYEIVLPNEKTASNSKNGEISFIQAERARRIIRVLE